MKLLDYLKQNNINCISCTKAWKNYVSPIDFHWHNCFGCIVINENEVCVNWTNEEN